MVTEKVRAIAIALQKISHQKIELAEILGGRKLTDEEKDELYCASIKDQFALIFETCPEIRPQELYLAIQIEEIYSSENIYYAGQEVNHPPTEEEIQAHYINSDRPSRFREKFNEIFNLQI